MALVPLIVVALVAVSAAIVLRAATTAPATSAARTEPIPVAERVAAPTDRRPLLAGDGEMGLAELRGEIVVLNFWASWCGPCRAEQPDLNAVHDEFQDRGVAFLGVDIQDTRVNGLAHVREFSIPYDSLFDPDSSYAAEFGGIGPRAIPTTLIIDRQGRIAARLLGKTTERELTVVLERLLGEQTQS